MTLAGALVAGCAIGVAGTLVVTGAPRADQLAPAPSSSSVMSERFPFAKSAAEVRLFEASEKSCGLIAATGMRVKLSGGNEERYFKVDYIGGPIEAVQIVDPDSNASATRVMGDLPPYVCWPAMLAQQFERGAPSTATAYMIDSMGSPDGSETEQFVLHMHTQSVEVSNLHLDVEDGLIVGYSGSQPNMQAWVADGDLTYDLTQAERDAIQAAVTNN